MRSEARSKAADPSRWWLGWLPAVALVAAGLAAAAGITPAGPAVAAPQQIDIPVEVSATVLAEVHINETCGGLVTFPVLNTTDGDIDSGGCDITFGSNNATGGAQLAVRDADLVAPFFCMVPDDCARDRFDDVPLPSATLGEGEFGAKVSVAIGTVGGWPLGTYHPVGAAFGSDACVTGGVGDATCTVVFGADPKPVQRAGDYDGTAEFQATAT